MKCYMVGIIWDTGEKEVYRDLTEAEAEEIAKSYRIAFGQQISYTWVTINR